MGSVAHHRGLVSLLYNKVHAVDPRGCVQPSWLQAVPVCEPKFYKSKAQQRRHPQHAQKLTLEAGEAHGVEEEAICKARHEAHRRSDPGITGHLKIPNWNSGP